MNNIKKLLVSMVALAFVVSCAGCAGNQQTGNTMEGTTSGVFAKSGDGSSATGQAAENEHQYEIVIETEYGDLYFPDQWKEFLVTDQTEGENTVEVSFSAQINEETYSLFTITIGGDADTPAGTLTSSDGTQRNVYVQIEEIQESNLLDESEQNRLYAMQEDINYLLDSLK